MDGSRYFNKDTETMDPDDLDAVIDERIASTARDAAENSPFYRPFFKNHDINPEKKRRFTMTR